MKLIVAKNEKLTFQEKSRFFLRNLSIVILYTLGFSGYALLFLIWTINFKNFNELNLGWISIPIIGFLLGLIHLLFIYKGSLICRTITMLSILLYVFILPVIVANVC